MQVLGSQEFRFALDRVELDGCVAKGNLSPCQQGLGKSLFLRKQFGGGDLGRTFHAMLMRTTPAQKLEWRPIDEL